MSLTDFASIGSFISGVAVAITLIMLLLQMRQTNKNQRSLMQQGRSARTVTLLLEMTQPHLNQLIVRVDANDPTLEAADVLAYFRMLAAWFWHYEDSYLQFHAGTLDASGWEADLAALKSMIAYPGARAAWQYVRRYNSGKFHDFVDGLVQGAKFVQPPDSFALYKVHMAEAATPNVDPNITAAPIVGSK